jgi:hypothetical protein
MDGTAMIPVLFCIDIEPDPRCPRPGSRDPWPGYESTFRLMQDFRITAEEVTGRPARFGWYFRLDPQVALAYGRATWAFDEHPTLLAEMERHGDEIGIHPHAYRWLPDEEEWILDIANQDWVDHCLGTSLEAFKSVLGRPCASARFGDRWLNTATVNTMERLGLGFDLTIEPGLPASEAFVPELRVRGQATSFYRAPREPYEPARDDFQRPAPSGTRRIRLIGAECVQFKSKLSASRESSLSLPTFPNLRHRPPARC